MSKRIILHCSRPLKVEEVSAAFDGSPPVHSSDGGRVFFVDHPLLPVRFEDLSDDPHVIAEIRRVAEIFHTTGSIVYPEGIEPVWEEHAEIARAEEPQLPLEDHVDEAFVAWMERMVAEFDSAATAYWVTALNYSEPVGFLKALKRLVLLTDGRVDIDGESIDALQASRDLETSAWFAARAEDPRAVVSFDPDGIHIRDKRGDEVDPQDIGAISGERTDPESQRRVMDANARLGEIGESLAVQDSPVETSEGPGRRIGVRITAVLVLVCTAMILGAQWLQSAGWENTAAILVSLAVIMAALMYIFGAAWASPKAFRRLHRGIAASAPVVLGGLVFLLNRGFVDQIIVIASAVFLLYLLVFGLWALIFSRQNLTTAKMRRTLRRWSKAHPDTPSWPVVVAGVFPNTGGVAKRDSIAIVGLARDRIQVRPIGNMDSPVYEVEKRRCEARVEEIPLDLRGREHLLDSVLAGTPHSLVLRDAESYAAIALTPVDLKSHMISQGDAAENLIPIVTRLRAIGVPVGGDLPRL